MERRFKTYLWWKSNLNDKSPKGKSTVQMPSRDISRDNEISPALRRKDTAKKERNVNRRRIRGGPPNQQVREGQMSSLQESGMSSREREKLGILAGEGEMRTEADTIADLYAFQCLLSISIH